MKLNEIISCEYDIPIRDIKIDSRKVKKGDLFVAVHGYNVDHFDYIDDAIKNGAAAIITDKDYVANIPIIKVDNVNERLVEICKKRYQYNSKISLIGVTGTDGKTTTATIIRELLDKYKSCAYIGTNGLFVKEKLEKLDNTTPEVPDLYKNLKYIDSENIENVVMEVSSEALLHKRVDGLRYKYAIFTNISEDHLNIHKTLHNYINAKLKLVDLVDGYIIFNKDDNNLDILKKYKNAISYGKDESSDFVIKDARINRNYSTFKIVHKDEVYNIVTYLIGEYNIYNLTASFIVCYLEGLDCKRIVDDIKDIKIISGRGEKIDFGQNYDLILDYAHTENGVKSLVNSLNKIYSNILVVTGAAGGREKEKRSKIGKFLLDKTSFVVFTMDDPRYEDVNDIIDDMLKDTDMTNYIRIVDRTSAINYALSQNEYDLVLIIGKGRDNYMAIEDKKLKYCDYSVIKDFFKK